MSEEERKKERKKGKCGAVENGMHEYNYSLSKKKKTH